jgi:two-component system chemotaxis response regulator CheB
MYALELGVVDIVEKPSQGGVSLDINERAAEIISKIRTAAHVKVIRTAADLTLSDSSSSFRHEHASKTEGPSKAATLELPRLDPALQAVPLVLAIGSSTGGPIALGHLLKAIPHEFFPPVVITQHLPAKFTSDFAQQLDAISNLSVVEAEDGMLLSTGFAYVAPGDYHMEIDSGMKIVLSQTPAVNHCRPSVDVLFNSIARRFGSRALGVVLTGMGEDGAQGSVALKKAGAPVIAQDEASCVVFGMPQAVIKAEAATKVLSLEQISMYLVQMSHQINSPENTTSTRQKALLQNGEPTTALK